MSFWDFFLCQPSQEQIPCSCLCLQDLLSIHLFLFGLFQCLNHFDSDSLSPPEVYVIFTVLLSIYFIVITDRGHFHLSDLFKSIIYLSHQDFDLVSFLFNVSRLLFYCLSPFYRSALFHSSIFILIVIPDSTRSFFRAFFFFWNLYVALN